MTVSFVLEALVVLGAIVMGTRAGGVGVGLWGGLGTFVLVFVFGEAPGEPPAAALAIILAVVTTAALMQAAGGVDWMVAMAAKVIESRPKQITLIAPLTAFLFSIGAGTSNIIYPLLPVIYDVSYKNGIRPSRPLTVTVVQSGIALAASPVSAAMAAMLTLTEVAPYNLGLTEILAITIPACVVGIVVTSLVTNRMWKELDDDPEVQARIASGELASRHAPSPRWPPDRAAPETRSPQPTRPVRPAAPDRLDHAAAHLHHTRSQLGPGLLRGRARDRVPRPVPRPPARRSTSREKASVPIDMTTTIVLVMFVVGAVILYVGRPNVTIVPDQSVFKAGMISAIALFGIAWLTATFISAHEDYIIGTIGEWVTNWEFLFALAVFLVAALTTSQSTATRTIVPDRSRGRTLPRDRDRHVGRRPRRRLHAARQRHPDRRGQLRPLRHHQAGHQADRPQLLHPHARAVGHHDRGRRADRRRLLLSTGPRTYLNTRDRTEQQMQTQEVADKAAALMPELMEELKQLVAIPSCAFPGYPSEPVMEMAERALAMFREVGFTNAQLMDVPTGYPPIYGEIPGPEGSPVVMLYGHYDVQPAPPEQGWTTDPWTPTELPDGRLYGRGAADDKGGLAIHLGTLRIFDGKPPCTVRLIVEGMEETESNLEPFVDAHPELFDC